MILLGATCPGTLPPPPPEVKEKPPPEVKENVKPLRLPYSSVWTGAAAGRMATQKGAWAMAAAAEDTAPDGGLSRFGIRLMRLIRLIRLIRLMRLRVGPNGPSAWNEPSGWNDPSGWSEPERVE